MNPELESAKRRGLDFTNPVIPITKPELIAFAKLARNYIGSNVMEKRVNTFLSRRYAKNN